MNWLPSVSAHTGKTRGVAVQPAPVPARRLERAVRAVQRQPATTVLDPRADGLLLLDRRTQIARVRDEEVRPGDRLDVGEVLRHLDPDVVILGKQLEQLEPGEVEVVVLAGAHQVGVDPALHGRVNRHPVHQSGGRRTSPTDPPSRSTRTG